MISLTLSGTTLLRRHYRVQSPLREACNIKARVYLPSLIYLIATCVRHFSVSAGY